MTLNLQSAIDSASAAEGQSQQPAGGAQDVAATPPPLPPSQSSPPSGDGQQRATPEQQQQWSLRAELQKNFNLPETQFADDKAAWGHIQQQILLRQQEYDAQLAQLQEMARWGQHYLQNRAQFEAQRGAPASQPSAPANPLDPNAWGWNVPQWNDADLQGLVRDEKTGEWRVAPGYAPDLVQRYQSYQRWLQESFTKFMRDPIGTLRPGLEALVSQLAEKMIGERVQGYDDRQFATSYVRGQDWLYQKDQSGNVIRDRLGQPLLSPAGVKFRQYLEYSDQVLGIRDVRQQQAYAQAMLERDAYQGFYTQYQPGQSPGAPAPGGAAPAADPNATNAALKANALKGGAQRLPGSGGSPPASTPPDSGGIKPRAAFGSRLKDNLAKANITNVG